MGITGFSVPAVCAWIRSPPDREAPIHPFGEGRLFGSGQTDVIMKKAELDGHSRFEAIEKCLKII
jgi:hypothetical protein